MDALGVFLLILIYVAPILQYLAHMSQRLTALFRKDRQRLADASEVEVATEQDVSVAITHLRTHSTDADSVEPPPSPVSPPRRMQGSKLKSLVRKFKAKPRGYTGISVRRKEFLSTIEATTTTTTPAAARMGTCFQCGLQKTSTELQDASDIDGLSVGICNECYPEYFQFLLEEEASDPCVYKEHKTRVNILLTESQPTFKNPCSRLVVHHPLNCRMLAKLPQMIHLSKKLKTRTVKT